MSDEKNEGIKHDSNTQSSNVRRRENLLLMTLSQLVVSKMNDDYHKYRNCENFFELSCCCLSATDSFLFHLRLSLKLYSDGASRACASAG